MLIVPPHLAPRRAAQCKELVYPHIEYPPPPPPEWQPKGGKGLNVFPETLLTSLGHLM